MITTDNALDPPPVRRRRGKLSRPRLAAIVAGVVIAAAVGFAVVHIVLQHPGTRTAPAGFERGGGGGQQQTQPPPAVAPQAAAQMQSTLQAMQRAASSPALAARPVQMAAVSPPAGPPPGGVGVRSSKTGFGPAAG